MIHDAFCTCVSPCTVSVLAALAAGSLDDFVTWFCSPVKNTRGTAATAATAGATDADIAGCAAEAAGTAATAASCCVVVTSTVI